MLMALMLVLAGLQAGQEVRPTIVSKPVVPPPLHFRVIYYDDQFLFAERGYGSAGSPGGNTEPGLFVHSKRQNRWVQISAISTAGGRFGTSQTGDPDAAKRLSLSMVGWAFTDLALKPYADQPLRTPGSIVFPDRIEYDARANRYVLHYMSSWKITTAETVLYVDLEDLNRAFGGTVPTVRSLRGK